jgi:hypothetical protein
MTIYCEWEEASFPKFEFYQDDKGRWIHRDRAPLHTKEGMALVGETWSSPAELSNPHRRQQGFGDELLD